MNLSSRYTHITIRSVARNGGDPAVNEVRITVTMALVGNSAGGEIDQRQLAQLIVSSLNHHAGGMRTINNQQYNIVWEKRWVHRVAIENGSALGVALVPDAALGAANADGMWAVNQLFHGGPEVSRILLSEHFARQALSRRSSVARVGRSGFGNSATHEVGHALNVSHQADTVMNHSNTTRLDRRMSDAQIAEILDSHLRN
jgi:hypothetical protein